MRLTAEGLKDREAWLAAGYQLPQFDRDAMIAATKAAPVWAHFGSGNICKAFLANAAQRMLNEGHTDKGLVLVDREIVEKLNRKHDDYHILVTLKADGNVEKTVVGSVSESCMLDSRSAVEFGRLKEIFTNESLQMVSFTITEKGYSLVNAQGEYLPEVEDDFIAGPDVPMSYMGKVAALLYARFRAGQKPLAMVSMDNCSHNGDKLAAAIHAFAEKWEAACLVEDGFTAYVKNPAKVSFPWTMIDKITPRPDASVEKILREDGVEDLDYVVTKRGTHVAPFVNAEECEYLVIEDSFPNGRPELEKAGLIFAERETVERVEKMKVCTCLNPLHTALAVFGCLLGYEKISEEMKDAELKKLVEIIGYTEGLPVVVDPGILDPREFIDTVLNVRIPNPFMPDTPQRIACDTSQKLSVRFGETIKAYGKREDLDVQNLKLIPVVFAGWLRYLTGIDNEGNAFEVSPDPMLELVRPYVADLKLGSVADVEALRPVLENDRIFGVNLFKVGLAEKVVGFLNEMLVGPGAVRATLKKYTGGQA